MAENGHHGEGVGTNCFKLCHFGAPFSPYVTTITLVVAINKGSSKEPMVMHLLHCLWFFSVFFEINISASHVPGVLNTAADMLSRNRTAQFLCSYPSASGRPMQVSTPLLRILYPRRLDWTSRAFLRHFNHTIRIVQAYSHTLINLSNCLC